MAINYITEAANEPSAEAIDKINAYVADIICKPNDCETDDDEEQANL